MAIRLVTIKKNQIPSFFSIKNMNGKYKLGVGRAREIDINLPFFLDTKIAHLCGMVMDGSLSKILSSISFSQKKDKSKVLEFEKIISEKFGLDNSVFRIGNNNTPT